MSARVAALYSCPCSLSPPKSPTPASPYHRGWLEASRTQITLSSLFDISDVAFCTKVVTHVCKNQHGVPSSRLIGSAGSVPAPTCDNPCLRLQMPDGMGDRTRKGPQRFANLHGWPLLDWLVTLTRLIACPDAMLITNMANQLPSCRHVHACRRCPRLAGDSRQQCMLYPRISC
jgi:hypothetical protein